MKNNSSKPFQGTYKYYQKYRPEIPDKVINVIINHFKVKQSDRVLDLGCGTGQVASALDGRCAEIACLDPDPEMLNLAKEKTANCTTKLTWINRPAKKLAEIKEKLGPFKLATSSRAFHRIEADKVLKVLDDLVKEGGGVALFSDRVLWGGNKEWQQTLKKTIDKYKKEKLRKGKNRASDERWEDILARSPFDCVTTREVPKTRTWEIGNIIGYTFSTAHAAPYLFDEDLDEFKEKLKDKLLSINPEGKFRENAVWRIVLGSRKPLK